MNLRKYKPLIGVAAVASGLAIAGAAQMANQQTQQKRDQQNRVETEQAQTPAAEEERIGVVENNRVFEAYPPAQQFNQELMAAQQEFAMAQQQGDQQKLQEIQQRFMQMQQELQKRYESDLEAASRELARDRELDLIVTSVLYAPENVEEVDLTEEMIEVITNGQNAGEPQTQEQDTQDD